MSSPTTADAGPPAATGRTVVERPPPGPARGTYGWPAWAIALLGASVVALTLAFLWRRHRRERGS